MSKEPQALGKSGWDRPARWTIAVASVMLVALSVAVLHGWTERIDHVAVLLMRREDNVSVPLGPSWLVTFFIVVTNLGSSAALGIMAATATTFLLIVRKRSNAIFLISSAVGGRCLFNLLKLIIGRQRPEIALHLVPAGDFSFPSGHSTDSAATYLALALIFAAYQPSNWPRLLGFGVAVIMVGLIGVSRVYLGVHYPTDVLAGWCCGTVWVLSCWLVSKRLSLPRSFS